ncbi:MAG TPA: hypothetical protein VF597_02375 [Candidatus Saccharimonadales bacterium]|jgi:hypothetical protein
MAPTFLLMTLVDCNNPWRSDGSLKPGCELIIDDSGSFGQQSEWTEQSPSFSEDPLSWLLALPWINILVLMAFVLCVVWIIGRLRQSDLDPDGMQPVYYLERLNHEAAIRGNFPDNRPPTDPSDTLPSWG